MNELQRFLGYDEETGVYARPNLLRRLAQQYLAFDREISYAELGRRIGVSREVIRLYFLGQHPRSASDPRPNSLSRPRPRGATRRVTRLRVVRDCREFEDAVERAIEEISRERDLSPPPLDGESHDYIQHEVVVRDLMSAPPRRAALPWKAARA